MNELKKCHGEYSLWIMPSGEVYAELNNIILGLSQRYNSPLFKPHITLTGGLFGDEKDLIEKTRNLANNVKPFDVKLNTLGLKCVDEYFKSLFIKVKETNQIMDANKKAREIFNYGPNTKYMPHMSLIYGNFSNELKNEIISDVGKDLNLEFKVDEISLYSIKGKVKDWHDIGRFSLL
jgi:2'-5' RNA ligase